MCLFQDSHDIYFVSLRDIEPGEQLRVWYSQQYGAKMKAKPLLSKKTKTKDFVNLGKFLNCMYYFT